MVDKISNQLVWRPLEKMRLVSMLSSTIRRLSNRYSYSPAIPDQRSAGGNLFAFATHADEKRTFRSAHRPRQPPVSAHQPQRYSTDPILPPALALPIIISGPSGVGKDAVIKQLQRKRPDVHFVVTATSRAMRPGERDGVDYFFVTKEQFERWIAEDRLLEHAVVYGEYKGIPKEQVESALVNGSDVILRVDVQGAATMKRLLPEAVSVFLVAESEKELVDRLVARKTEEGDRMRTRIETAREEMGRMREFDYVVVNRDGQMRETVERIESIVNAEKSRTGRLLP